MLKLLILPSVGAWLAAQAPSVTTDPLGFITQLGVSGGIAAAFYLWQRDTSKKLDKAMAVIEQSIPIMAETRDALRAASETARASTEAHKLTAEVLRRVPSDETITRLRVALERSERRA